MRRFTINPALLVRYFQHQKRHGVHPLTAAARLPRNAVRYLLRLRQEGRQIYGYGRYDLPLLASYSRSGTNWLRYIIETLSGRPTPRQVRVHYGADFVIDRAHKAYPVMRRYPRVILLLRDYRECLLRHHSDLWQALGDVQAFLQDESVFQQPDWYIHNLAAFDRFPRPKLLISYEQLLSDSNPVVRELAGFLQCGPAAAESFIEDLDRHVQASVAAYTKGGHRSATRGNKGFRYHAKKHLSLAQQKQFDDFYARRYTKLYERYLKEYAVPEKAGSPV